MTWRYTNSVSFPQFGSAGVLQRSLKNSVLPMVTSPTMLPQSWDGPSHQPWWAMLGPSFKTCGVVVSKVAGQIDGHILSKLLAIQPCLVVVLWMWSQQGQWNKPRRNWSYPKPRMWLVDSYSNNTWQSLDTHWTYLNIIQPGASTFLLTIRFGSMVQCHCHRL